VILPSLAETVAAQRRCKRGQIGKRVADAASLDSQRAELDAEERALSAVQRPGAYGPRGLNELFALSDLASALRASDRRLTATIETLSSTAKAFDADLDRLAAYDAKATQWLQTARARNAPATLITRIEAVPKRNEGLARNVRAKRDQALDLLSRATRMSIRAKALRSEIGDRRLQLEAQMRSARVEPLWQADTDGAVRARALESARAEVSQIVDFLVAHAVLICGTAIAAFTLALMLVVAARSKLAALGDSFGQATSRLFEAPATAAIMLTLLTPFWLVQVAPASFYGVVLSLMTIPAALLSRAAFADRGSLSLFMLTAAMLSVGLLGPVVDPLPLEGGLLLIAQCVAVAAGLVVDLRWRVDAGAALVAGDDAACRHRCHRSARAWRAGVSCRLCRTCARPAQQRARSGRIGGIDFCCDTTALRARGRPVGDSRRAVAADHDSRSHLGSACCSDRAYGCRLDRMGGRDADAGRTFRLGRAACARRRRCQV
jgi:hypothetical protein